MESLECLTKECISLLHKNNLLKPLIKNELVKNSISKVSIENELKEKTIKSFIIKLGVSDQASYETWLSKNNCNHSDIENLALGNLRLKQYCKNEFGHLSESRFLERKGELDIIVYSLIRVKDSNKARELYIRIAEEEANFGDLAAMFSEGLENKTRGIIGPTPLGTAHPKMIEHLRNSKPGEVQPPIMIEDSHIVIRVESLDPAQLDDFMREKMSEELFNNWIETQVQELHADLMNKTLLNTAEGKP